MIALLGTIIFGLLFWFDIVVVDTFIICTVLVLIAEPIMAALYFKLDWFRFYYHDLLHWHVPADSGRWHDGCSWHNICKHCRQGIMQDSQGNWFT